MSITRRTLISGGSALMVASQSPFSVMVQPLAASPANPRQLFAWASPADFPGARWDHTWVTTYDNRTMVYNDIQAVSAAKEFFWYAWGDFHPQGGTPINHTGYLGSQKGELNLSECTALANADCRDVPGARGTIFAFGIDGVCHQLANQILYSSTASNAEPLTVSMARGYWASSYLYHTYGLNQESWDKKKASCGTKAPAATSTLEPKLERPDDFEIRARDLLKGQDQKIKDLLALRSEMHRLMSESRTAATQMSSEALNARNQEKLDEAAKLLGPETFEKLFGYPPNYRIYLVDPAMMRPTK